MHANHSFALWTSDFGACVLGPESSAMLTLSAQKVAFALLTRGRLTLLQLVRYTSMKARAVRASVLVLIQHNLAWHAQSEDGVEVIEFNPEECILRLRFGRYVWQTEELLGAKVLNVHLFPLQNRLTVHSSRQQR